MYLVHGKFTWLILQKSPMYFAFATKTKDEFYKIQVSISNMHTEFWAKKIHEYYLLNCLLVKLDRLKCSDFRFYPCDAELGPHLLFIIIYIYIYMFWKALQ